jgi:hypothetical protein
MYLNIHEVDMKNHLEVIVTLCDRELIGKKFRDGELRLHVNPRFYKGELADREAIEQALASATIANIVGKRAIALAIKKGVILKNNVIEISGVPHAQMIQLRE